MSNTILEELDRINDLEIQIEQEIHEVIADAIRMLEELETKILKPNYED